MTRGLAGLAVVLLGLACAPVARAADKGDWPSFRGPNGQGVAADTANPPAAFGAGNNVAWKADLPPGHSSPVVAGGKVFCTALDAGRLVTICLDAFTGRVLWSRPAPAETIEKVHPLGSPASSTPVTDGQNVYAYFGSFGLIAYNADGAERWRRPLPPPATNGFGSGSSPVLVGGRIVLVTDTDTGASSITAFNANTGEVAWTTPRPLFMASWSTPVLWARDAVEELIVVGSGRLMAYDQVTGGQRWWVTGFPQQPIPVPAIGAGMLFAAKGGLGEPGQGFVSEIPKWDVLLKDHDTDGDGSVAPGEVPEDYGFQMRKEVDKDSPGNFMSMRQILKMIDGNKDGKVGRLEWALANTMMSANEDMLLAVRPGGTGDATETHVAWKGRRGVPEIPSPLFYRDRLYLVKNGGMVTCIDPVAGKAVYRQRLGAGGQYAASPVAADGRIYAASESGVVSVIKAGDAFEILTENDLGERIMATPAIVGDRLYVRTGRHLFAFRKGANRPDSDEDPGLRCTQDPAWSR